jgi:DNA mismatch endonuclease (patch repair protein)
MLANKSRDTNPELAVRRLVHAAGLRYRVDARPISGVRRRGDLVFPRARVVVLVDGCYWHGCPDHFRVPKANADYWSSKIMANVERDRDTDARFRAEGWTVLRYWEHEDSATAAADIVSTVHARWRALRQT